MRPQPWQQAEPLFSRHPSNPILTTEDWPYPCNSVFNPAVARLDALGHTNRELRGLKLAAGEVPQRNAPVMAGAAEAGHITSAAVHPLDHRPLALAMLKSKHVRPGTTLAVPGPSGGIAATVFWPSTRREFSELAR